MGDGDATVVRPPLRLAILGGGPGSFIGDAHRLAAKLDGRYALVAGMFSTSPERSRRMAAEVGVDPERAGHDDWRVLLDAEAARPDGAEVVSVITPNHLHHPMVLAALEHGFDVICDKPLTTTLDDALELRRVAHERGLVLGVTYNYSGYPMVRHARAMVAGGQLGELRLVQVEHASGWASRLLEADGHKQASWRTDPDAAGASTVVGDLGVHAHQLTRYVTGREVTEVSAELSTLVPGRRTDDNAHINLHLTDGLRGLLWCSIAATGHAHGLRIRVYGADAGLEWHQEDPEHLTVRPADGPPRRLARGAGYLSPAAAHASRIGLGHPEGFFEAFATVYRDIADAVVERRHGVSADPLSRTWPDAGDGVLGVAFVEAAVASHRAGGAWTDATVVPMSSPGS